MMLLTAERGRLLDGLFRGAECSMPIGIFPGQFGTEVAGGRVDIDLALAQSAGDLGVAGRDGVSRVACLDDDEVGLIRTYQLANLGSRLRKSLGQPLEVVNKLSAFPQVEERVVVFAFLAAQLPHLGDAQRHHGQCRIDLQRSKRGVREGRTHVNEFGEPQVRLVGTILAN